MVTRERRAILTTEVGRRALRASLSAVPCDLPFVMTAIALLPDHLHAIREWPRGEADDSTRWRSIKSLFTRAGLAEEGVAGPINVSRSKRHEQGVWQRRFFEHTCRDEEDLNRCLDYVHVNSVKHRLVPRVADWPWSSFHRYVRLGKYDVNRGGSPEMYGEEFNHA